ncbi:hypothetical protein [Nocardiopsis composta]|uniref:Uncharacterized protein n=1 Tax=Nocardiopsis composta TaxID=157465 RepID=A0A7W8QIQ8_9ACTN|nr:hypothetical protein [Nocardiopsis composta]MBB5431227.1 hypothetical protein [Nocardiopsis composta]
MNTNRALAAGAAVAAAAAVAILLPTLGVLWTLVLVALALLLAFVGLMTGLGRREGGLFSGGAEPPPAVPGAVRAHQVSGVRLATAKEDYGCLFSAVVQARNLAGEDPPDEGRMAAACESVLHRAEEYTRHRAPERVGVAVYGLAALLGRPVRLEQEGIELCATGVEITLPEEDAQRLMRMAAVRKDREVREHEWGEARDRRRYFQDDVLASPASAVVWWLFANQGKVREADRMIGPLSRLSEISNGGGAGAPRLDAAEEPDRLLEIAGELVEKVGEERGEAEQDAFTDRFARLLREHGEEELSALLREKYESPDLAGYPPGGAAPAGAGAARPSPDEADPPAGLNGSAHPGG